MKVLEQIKKHKVLVTSSIIAVACVTGVAFTLNKAAQPVASVVDLPESSVEAPKDVEKPKEVSDVAETATDLDAPTARAATPKQNDAATVEKSDTNNEMAVKSTDEYAANYLKLGTVANGLTGKDCFDGLVAAFPNRFAEPVRERNIKALSVYENPCMTGYGGGSDILKRSWDAKYPNGSFFDSDLAKSRW